ncbi:hypothetical protein [Chitinophaga pinensis]|uniref:hypothetical protein n=1 Tax=Chitinophaga pinensis TaxID=79329 RepID=UPI001C99DFF2|nr:hypothetical protein [Chitinophaga pinensis]
MLLWKGYAYAAVGSLYYAGLIVDQDGVGSNRYVVKDSVLAASDKYLQMAAGLLSTGIASTEDYNAVLGKLIPSFCQVGKGGILTPDMWIRNINTMLARNLLINKLAPFVNGNPDAVIGKASTGVMTAADWNQVLTLSGKGIRNNDLVFTGRSAAANGFSVQRWVVSLPCPQVSILPLRLK